MSDYDAFSSPVSKDDPYAAFSSAAQSGKTSQALGFEQGVGKFLANAASPAISLGEKLGVPMDWAKKGAQIIQNPENPSGDKPGAIGRFGAEMLETAPAMIGGPLVGGGIAGWQLRDDDSLKSAATATGGGAVGGYLGDRAIRGAASVISPTVNRYAQALLGEGVRLTPGQILGGVSHRIEDKLASVPIVGDFIQNARIRGLQDFNRAAINRSLNPIGAQIAPDATGRGAIDAAHQALSNEYTNIFNQGGLPHDPVYQQNSASLLNLAQNIPQYGARPLHDFINTEITPRLSAGGNMTGQSFKEVDSLLGQNVRDYTSSQNPNDRALGRAYQQLQTELRDSFGRSNPTLQQPLANADAGYANLVRIENAAARQGGAKGVDPGTFTPAQLGAAVRATDNSVRKNAVARGNALMQDLSDAGQAVLPAQVPDSGTAGRLAAMLLAGGGAAHVVSPAAIAPGLALAGTYTQPGIRAAEYALARRPASAQRLAAALRNNSQLGAIPGAAGLSQLLGGGQ